MQIRKFKEARETFSSFLAANAEHPDRALAMYRLGECSFFLNEPKAAQTAFDDFLSKHADNELAPWAWQYLGESRLQLADPAGALKAFQTVGEKFPKSSLVPESKFGIARANEALKDLDAAVAAYTELSADVANPRAADALFHIGTLQYDAGHYAEAAKAFSAVRERFPDSSQAARADLNAGYSLFYLGDYDKAAEAFEQAAKSPEDEATARLWIGLSRKSQNRYADAVAVLQPAYEKLGNSGQAEKLLFQWADSTFRAGDGAAAAPLFLQLVEKFPKGEMADRALHLAVESSLQARKLEQAEKLHQRFVAE
jgi:TolA-binding protein